jgi:hypothetical protein
VTSLTVLVPGFRVFQSHKIIRRASVPLPGPGPGPAGTSRAHYDSDSMITTGGPGPATPAHPVPHAPSEAHRVVIRRPGPPRMATVTASHSQPARLTRSQGVRGTTSPAQRLRLPVTRSLGPGLAAGRSAGESPRPLARRCRDCGRAVGKT